MQYVPPYVLSLAFQRGFPRVFSHSSRLLDMRRNGEHPRLSWPAWCAFPVGLALDLLREHYGYARDGVEPCLLAALAGWRLERRLLRLDAEAFARAADAPEINDIPVSTLFTLPWNCLYVEYPSGVGALGSFLFQDWNGPGQETLFMLLHLEPWRVEPLAFPLVDRDATLARLYADHAQARRHGPRGQLAEQGQLFEQALDLALRNLGVLSFACGLGVDELAGASAPGFAN